MSLEQTLYQTPLVLGWTEHEQCSRRGLSYCMSAAFVLFLFHPILGGFMFYICSLHARKIMLRDRTPDTPLGTPVIGGVGGSWPELRARGGLL